jgi:hypothetical protein
MSESDMRGLSDTHLAPDIAEFIIGRASRDPLAHPGYAS